MMLQLQVSTVLSVVHCFYTYTLSLHCLNLAEGILQAQLQAQAEQVQRLQATQEAPAEVHRRELQAVQEREAQRSQDIARFFGSLNLPGVVVPPSLLTPFVPPSTSPTGTPVSIYGCLLL